MKHSREVWLVKQGGSGRVLAICATSQIAYAQAVEIGPLEGVFCSIERWSVLDSVQTRTLRVS